MVVYETSRSHLSRFFDISSKLTDHDYPAINGLLHISRHVLLPFALHSVCTYVDRSSIIDIIPFAIIVYYILRSHLSRFFDISSKFCGCFIPITFFCNRSWTLIFRHMIKVDWSRLPCHQRLATYISSRSSYICVPFRLYLRWPIIDNRYHSVCYHCISYFKESSKSIFRHIIKSYRLV